MMPPQDEAQWQMQRAQQVQHKYEPILLRKPHVVGVAIGYARMAGETTPEIALVVMVDQKLAPDQLALDDLIPSRLDGIRVDVQETGTFSAGAADIPTFGTL